MSALGRGRAQLAAIGRPLAMGLALAAGCTPAARWVAPVAVGPAPVLAGDDGELLVYSADDAVDTADAGHPHHRSYVIRATDGAVLRTVENQSGPFGQDPEDVTLPPGRYTIDTSATNVGPVRVPVVIEQGHVTVVHLDGDAAADPVPAATAVRLPDGSPIGARASVD